MDKEIKCPVCGKENKSVINCSKWIQVKMMNEFVGDKITYIGVGEPVGVILKKPIATVKFDVRSPGIYKVEVRQDGSWIAVRDYLCKKGKKK